ncbi:hypothetical protein [Pseudoalteromonas sp.]|uniref:hypothetical protein n=1 Tax=Pseudoalteromonas sp. TaxID=53249 RepID=UPI003562CC82
MIDKQLEIQGENCCLTVNKYELFPTEVTLDYIEHSTYEMHDDTETNIDIDKEKAIEIIKFLQDAFDI